ncbi:MAG TPA: sigma-70 family RNA polymerase sigma factor [Novosphingobium sp.]|nr:sigma-70 family RNA polymerase sigma factor [Novosphingobium sp.]
MMRPLRNLRGVDVVARPDRVEASLWRRFILSGQARLRESLFERYRQFARSLARRHARRNQLGRDVVEDLEHFAYTGLLEAIDRYDPRKGRAFLAFATSRIAGSIVDGLGRINELGAQLRFRRRSERERVASLVDGEQEGTRTAVAQLADLVTELALGLMMAAQENAEAGPREGTADNAFDNLAWRQTQNQLRERVNGLDEIERTVIRQHYQNDLLFSQIATMLGVSRGRVSQIHKAALGKLRKTMRLAR